MLRIANPMYDAVFKHLLEDDAAARLIVGTILGEDIDELEMLRTFNCGVGFVLCVRPGAEHAVMRAVEAAGDEPVLVGEVAAAGRSPVAGHLLIEEERAALG